MQFFVIVIFLQFYLNIVICSGWECTKTNKSPLKRLKDDLFCDYDVTVRPMSSKANATKVGVKMILKSLHYSMYDSSIALNNWLVLNWNDEHLKWKPDDYDGLDLFHVNSYELWLPDLSVYNRAEQEGSPSAISEIKCLVYNTGGVICIPPNKHDAYCKPDLTNYPFDVQNCTIRYGSWIHRGEEVDFEMDKTAVSVEDYLENGEWRLVSVIGSKHGGHYNCCPDSTFPSLNYNFVISRNSGVHVCMTVTPAVVMLVMTMISLCLNPQEIERIHIINCNILAHVLFIQFLFWEIPVSGPEPPLIVIYCRDSLVLAMFILILTMIERRLLKLTTQSPLWVSMVVAYVVKSRPAHLIFIFDDNLKGVAHRIGDEDAANIVENSENQKNTDWIIFVKILDRICFVIYAFTFLYMIIRFV